MKQSGIEIISLACHLYHIFSLLSSPYVYGKYGESFITFSVWRMPTPLHGPRTAAPLTKRFFTEMVLSFDLFPLYSAGNITLTQIQGLSDPHGKRYEMYVTLQTEIVPQYPSIQKQAEENMTK